MTALNGEIIPLILAGGRGTRISHLHPDLPKPAVPVAGRPFLAWILKQLHEGGFTKAVVSSGYLAEKLRTETSPWVPVGMDIRWISENEPLGTAGGAAHAARDSGLSPQAWLVMNGDSYLAGDWIAAIGTSPAKEAMIVAREMDDTGRYGRMVTEGHRLVSFGEKQETGSGLINAGIYLLPDIFLKEIPVDCTSSLEREWIPAWLDAMRHIRVIRENGQFLDMGTPESLAKASDFMTHIYPHRVQ
jgi:D-glycero-alpha-D-manno-heptose 1-phosphate guanylyltransferase